MAVDPEELLPTETIDLELSAESRALPAFERPLLPQFRDFRLLTSPPWVRTLGKLTMEVGTQGWKFPTPPEAVLPAERQPSSPRPEPQPESTDPASEAAPTRTRILPPRDKGSVLNEQVSSDLVILDEAQRIKTRESKTAQVARSIRRSRSWAMSGTPIENRPDDLVNIFGFVDPQRIPPDTPTLKLPE